MDIIEIFFIGAFCYFATLIGYRTYKHMIRFKPGTIYIRRKQSQYDRNYIFIIISNTSEYIEFSNLKDPDFIQNCKITYFENKYDIYEGRTDIFPFDQIKSNTNLIEPLFEIDDHMVYKIDTKFYKLYNFNKNQIVRYQFFILDKNIQVTTDFDFTHYKRYDKLSVGLYEHSL